VKPPVSHEQVSVAPEEPQTRRELLRMGGIAAIASVLGVLGISGVTEGKNGSSLRIGSKNSGTRPTTLDTRKGPGFFARVSGSGQQVALRGQSGSQKGIGVQGIASASKGEAIGVQGQAKSPDGAGGRFVADGGATALEASVENRNGVALRTKGRLELTERSGVTTASGGAEFVIPVEGGVTEGSMVLATLQDHMPGLHVEAASVLDTEEGLIVVRLNQAVAEPTRVAWLVLD
jgi:hypothetical protein